MGWWRWVQPVAWGTVDSRHRLSLSAKPQRGRLVTKSELRSKCLPQVNQQIAISTRYFHLKICFMLCKLSRTSGQATVADKQLPNESFYLFTFGDCQIFDQDFFFYRFHAPMFQMLLMAFLETALWPFCWHLCPWCLNGLEKVWHYSWR